MAHRVSPQGGREWVRELGSIALRDPLAPRRQVQSGPTPLTRARARLRRSSLDRALAQGADPCPSPALAHRAARLTSERSRQRLATWIEAILAGASVWAVVLAGVAVGLLVLCFAEASSYFDRAGGAYRRGARVRGRIV